MISLLVPLKAAIAMIAQDILGARMVQAEADRRAVVAGLLDMAGWLCTILTLSWSLGSITKHGWTAESYTIIAFVSAANFIGTYVGTKTRKRKLAVVLSTDAEKEST